MSAQKPRSMSRQAMPKRVLRTGKNSINSFIHSVCSYLHTLVTCISSLPPRPRVAPTRSLRPGSRCSQVITPAGSRLGKGEEEAGAPALTCSPQSLVVLETPSGSDLGVDPPLATQVDRGPARHLQTALPGPQGGQLTDRAAPRNDCLTNRATTSRRISSFRRSSGNCLQPP